MTNVLHDELALPEELEALSVPVGTEEGTIERYVQDTEYSDTPEGN